MSPILTVLYPNYCTLRMYYHIFYKPDEMPSSWQEGGKGEEANMSLEMKTLHTTSIPLFI
jgi:hypothetical protein